MLLSVKSKVSVIVYALDAFYQVHFPRISGQIEHDGSKFNASVTVKMIDKQWFDAIAGSKELRNYERRSVSSSD